MVTKVLREAKIINDFVRKPLLALAEPREWAWHECWI